MTDIDRLIAMNARYRDLHPEFWDEDRALYVVKAAEWYTVEVMPKLFTAAIAITVTKEPEYVEDQWCYKTVTEAIEAAQTWDVQWPANEPDGWHRHPRSGRRRPNGDASKEVVYS